MVLNKYNNWNKWGHLKTVALGSCYDNDFFDSVADAELRDSLSRILEETNAELDYFEKVLKEWGADVIRPDTSKIKLSNFMNPDGSIKNNTGFVPSPPMTPRDEFIVIGDKRYDICARDINKKMLLDFNAEDLVDCKRGMNKKFAAPCMTLVGKDLYADLYDIVDHKTLENQFRIIQNNHPDLRINKLHIGGHNDGVFCVAKEGVLLSIVGENHYSKTFPGWDVCYLKGESWEKVKGFRELKRKVNGKWWVPGAESNDGLVMYVETWLEDWVGYVEESVLDVNNFMLDEKTMCVANPNNEIVRDYAKKHNIELVHVPWRHRYFWDGGLHCVTLDLNRDGEMEDFFPNRND